MKSEDSAVVLQVLVIIGLAHALVVFRVVANPLLSDSRWEFIRDNANTVAVMLGAVAHYITIQIMTVVSICSAQTFLTFSIKFNEQPTRLG